MSYASLQRTAVLCVNGFLLGVPCQAAPESWTLVRTEPIIAYYFGKATNQMNGRYLTYWILVNFNYDPKFEGAEPYKSATLLRYANCATREQDTKSLFQYRAPMGRGEPIWAQTFDEATMRMEAVEPGSVGAQILDIACSLKE